MSLATYLILAIGLILTLISSYLSAQGLFSVPYIEIFSYLVLLCGIACAKVKWGDKVAWNEVRKLSHKKFGFTCLFSFGCALLLSATGVVWQSPRLSDLSFPALKSHENGYRDPAAVRPGDTVKVHLNPKSQLNIQAISNLWKANTIKATLIMDRPRRLIPLKEVSSLPATETWEDVNPKDGKLYFRPTRQESTIPSFKNKDFRPWIQFAVPFEESLIGKNLTLHIEMTGVVPFLEKKGAYRTDEFRLNEDVPFFVVNSSQYDEFTAFLVKEAGWAHFQKYRHYAAMTFLLCGCVFFGMVRRKPRPAGVPVRLMSRRIGQ